MSSIPKTFKVVLLGEGRVGKTSLLLRYFHNTFTDAQQATIQASFLTKKLTVDGQQVELGIWDTAGQERFHALGPIYYRDAHAALLVFDVTDTDSFKRVQSWVKELRSIVGPGIVLAILANKQDLERERAVPEQVSAAYAKSIGATHFATSAKTGLGIDTVFQDTARRVLQSAQAASPAVTSPAGGVPLSSRRQGATVIVDDRQTSSQKSGCCST